MAGDEVDERGVIESMRDGTLSAGVFGIVVGASRAFLGSYKSPEPPSPFSSSPPSSSSSSSAAVSGATSAVASSSSSSSNWSGARGTLRRVAHSSQHPFAQIVSVTGLFAAVGAIYCGTRSFLHQQRQTDDLLNKTISGCAAGSAAGIRSGNLITGCTACATFAVANLFLHFVDGDLGYNREALMEKHKEIYKEIER